MFAIPLPNQMTMMTVITSKAWVKIIEDHLIKINKGKNKIRKRNCRRPKYLIKLIRDRSCAIFTEAKTLSSLTFRATPKTMRSKMLEPQALMMSQRPKMMKLRRW